MEERVPYAEMRSWLLECYYTFSRQMTDSKGGWAPHLHEIAYAYNEFDGAFDHPIERLMLEVLTLVLIGGRPMVSVPYHTRRIAEIVAAHPLDELLRGLPEEELHELRSALQLLKLL